MAKKTVTFSSGRKVVSAAATAEALVSADTFVLGVVIVAETNNTGVVAVGDSTVIAALATRTGVPLLVGEPVTIISPESDKFINLADIYLDVTVNGDGVTYMAWV